MLLQRLILLRISIFILVSFAILSSANADSKTIQFERPPVVMKNVEATIRVTIPGDVNTTRLKLLINNVPYKLQQDAKSPFFQYTFTKKTEVVLISGAFTQQMTVDPVPLWLSILPPLIAIIMALLTKEVFSSLFIGLLFGTTIIFKYAGFNYFSALLKGLFAVVDTYLLQALLSPDHVSIIIFCMLIGGMVTLISMNGGMKGIVSILARFANNRRSGQMITFLMGMLIFFDDYANTLVVGNTMRPVTDRLRISREKLAYLVDSTSAPIAAVAFITTWIGAELSYIQEGVEQIGLQTSPYSVFLDSLKYSFYPILTLVFVFTLIWQQRDFGPMFKFERIASRSPRSKSGLQQKRTPQIMKELEVADHIQARWFNALMPVLIVVSGTIIGLVYTGWDQAVWDNTALPLTNKLSHIIGRADTFKALIWSSLAGVLVAILLTVVQRILSLKESIEGLVNGFKTMLHAILILSLAWSIALLTKHLHTAEFITGSLKSIAIHPAFIPAITFVFSAFIAFSTGSSWGTMAIIYPLILPATWKIGLEYGWDQAMIMPVFYNVVSTVLAGSVLGDHCSPISDTTILSSLACSCNHINHVRTQLPYALVVGGIGLITGTIPTALGLPVWMSYLLGIAGVFLTIRLIGKRA